MFGFIIRVDKVIPVGHRKEIHDQVLTFRASAGLRQLQSESLW